VVVARCLVADTVRLKSGLTYEGTIVSETDAKVNIEVEYAGGTILSTESISKDEIAEIVRSTSEQQAQRAMEHAYANTHKYNLDPATSYTPNYYQRVIDRVLRRFLSITRTRLTRMRSKPNSKSGSPNKAKSPAVLVSTAASGSGPKKLTDQAEAQVRPATEHGKASESAMASTPAQRDIVDQIGELLRRYWVIAIVAVVAMHGCASPLFTHD